MGGHPMPIGGGYPRAWFDPEAAKRPDPVALRAVERARRADQAEQAVYARLGTKALLRVSTALCTGTF